MTMILSLLLGIGCALALHFHYSNLDTGFVGDSMDQERALRWGTALSFFCALGFVFSINESFTQWLWRDLTHHTITIRALDASFSATSDISSFANTEMLRRSRIASVLALLSLLVPFSSFITQPHWV